MLSESYGPSSLDMVARESPVPDVVPGPWRYNGLKKRGNQLDLWLINCAWRFRRHVEVSQARGRREV